MTSSEGSSTRADEGAKQYLIRHPGSGLVLQAKDTQITTQYFTGYSEQLWRFENGNRPGLFYIINEYTGKVIDFHSKTIAFLNKRVANNLNQQWILNANGRITNANNGLNLDIDRARYVPGTLIKLWDNNNNNAQNFTLQQKS